MFKKILIANRGEIAVRVLRACRELGIQTVGVFSEADRTALHVRLADEAYPIGPAASRESYLRIDKLMDVARRAGCDALHPGYGFLAENPGLPRACKDAGITFIGPSAEAMEAMGSKTAGKQLARRAEVPTVPGTSEANDNPEEVRALAQDMGYPVVLKAVAGGGGKGMRVVNNDAEFSAAWRDAASEALNAFGDARVFLEKYLIRPRHVEIQVFADAHGRVVSLGERECSVQRRHQKVIEEAPSPVVTPDLRKKMGEAAVRLARAGGLRECRHSGISGGRATEFLFFGSEYTFASGASGDRAGDRTGPGKTADRDCGGTPIAVCVGNDYAARPCDGSAIVRGRSG